MSFKKITCALCLTISIDCGMGSDNESEEGIDVKHFITVNTDLSSPQDKDSEQTSPSSILSPLRKDNIENKKNNVSTEEDPISLLPPPQKLETDQKILRVLEENSLEEKNTFIEEEVFNTPLTLPQDKLPSAPDKEKLFQQIKENFSIIKEDGLNKDQPLPSEKDFDITEKKLNLKIPSSLKEYFLEVGNRNITPYPFACGHHYEDKSQLESLIEEWKNIFFTNKKKEKKWTFIDKKKKEKRLFVKENKEDFINQWIPFSKGDSAFWCCHLETEKISLMAIENGSKLIEEQQVFASLYSFMDRMILNSFKAVSNTETN